MSLAMWNHTVLSPVTLAITVAEFGDYSRRKRRQFVAKNADYRRIRQLLSKTATVASVDRPLPSTRRTCK